MAAVYGGCFYRRLQDDPAFREADEFVRAIERRRKLAQLEVEGLEARLRDPRSDFAQIANAQCELDDARKRLEDVRTEMAVARQRRDAFLTQVIDPK